MKKTINYLYCCVFVFITIFLFSCQKNGSQNDLVKQDDNYVSEQQAQKIAVDFMTNKIGYDKKSQGKSISAANSAKSIKSIVGATAKDNSNAFYVINYNEGGWAIVSADRRTQKILAFSDKNSFDLNNMPIGVANWTNNAKVQIDQIRGKKIKYEGQDKVEFFPKTTIDKNLSVMIKPIDTSCTPWIKQVAPLTQTEWGQEQRYNENLMNLPCGPGGHMYAGCWTTAMAQVFRYKQYPAIWNYSIMPNKIETSNLTSTGANEIRNMLKDISLQTVKMEGINCLGTTTYNDDALIYLKTIFSYADQLVYAGTAAYEVVKSDLDNGHPVIFTGKNPSSSSTGHAWVCDGYVESLVCNEYGGQTGALNFLFFNMRWGYEGTYDGFYGFNNFIDPVQFNWNNDVKVYVGLHN